MLEPEDIDTVAVIGAGFIGLGWVHLFCRAGLATRLYDSDAAALDRTYRMLQQELDLFREVGLIDAAEREAGLGRVALCHDLHEACAGAQYLQECVPEDLEIKQAVFAAMDRATSPDAILASSVSALAMTEIARDVRHPARCVVAHPTNPPHLIPLVEVAAGALTSLQVVDTTFRFLERIGQKPILVNTEIFGYVLNRLQFALVREAFYLAREGAASPAAIDRCITEGLGLRWALTGPFMVEELNAANIADDLLKYGPMMRALTANLGHWDGPSAEDITMATEGVSAIMGNRTHDEMADWRARRVLEIRRLKEQA
ncbi:MAG: 3-hydroxyacyl-CoA dehydrogenase NAD-binding domain-containing protein [Chloroflexota bacterium]